MSTGACWLLDHFGHWITLSTCLYLELDNIEYFVIIGSHPAVLQGTDQRFNICDIYDVQINVIYVLLKCARKVS